MFRVGGQRGSTHGRQRPCQNCGKTVIHYGDKPHKEHLRSVECRSAKKDQKPAVSS